MALLLRSLMGSVRCTSRQAFRVAGSLSNQLQPHQITRSSQNAGAAMKLPFQQRCVHMSSQLLNSSIINIQDGDDFSERVTKNTCPVIVDFHATWCGPCKILGPRLEALVAENEGKVIMAKVDIDENSDIAIDHGVEAVPTVLAIKQGEVVDKFVGVKDNDQLVSFVNKLVGK